MLEKKFTSVSVKEGNEFFEKLIQRENSLYSGDDFRSPFSRDYTRILHSTAYRRLKHKTQVFYNIENDHICTRMEHVCHVESVSYTIAKSLGLNDELTKAIASGHDLGHAPFGHYGETVINELFQKYLSETFYHEKNGLYFVDNIELLPDRGNDLCNLSLTYAVRDGIISHCGELDENVLIPRSDFIDLKDYKKGTNPITFEGCVVKISDKIAYLGRDIEDAVSLGFLSKESVNELSKIIKLKTGEYLNTGNIIHGLILDVINCSSPEEGIRLSEETGEKLNRIKAFNYKYIYENERFEPYKKYAKLVINEIFGVLYSLYGNYEVNFDNAVKKYPVLISDFNSFLSLYNGKKGNKNQQIYKDMKNEKVFIRAVLDFISGMTDKYAVNCFNELITF